MYLVIYFIAMMATAFYQGKSPGKTIIFFGDSITAGYGVGTDLAFPKLLQDKLSKNGYHADIVNAGLSGETSAGGVTRIDWILNREFDIFVLELGANDGLRGLPLAETAKNLQRIIDKVKARYPQTVIVLAGMRVPPNMGEAYTQEFAGLYAQLAGRNNALLIPFILQDVAGNEALNQPDGIHPNAHGHRIIADNLYPFFRELLE